MPDENGLPVVKDQVASDPILIPANEVKPIVDPPTTDSGNEDTAGDDTHNNTTGESSNEGAESDDSPDNISTNRDPVPRSIFHRVLRSVSDLIAAILQTNSPRKTAFVLTAVLVVIGAIVAICVILIDPPPSREKEITDFINSKSYMGFHLSPTGRSPEERAIQWLINDDPLQLNVGDEEDEFRLLQRYSLLTLWFQSDTGTAWINFTNWLTADECSWACIDCEGGVVTVVDFFWDEIPAAIGLKGTLSPDLALLTALTVLDLRRENLSGSLPSEIGLLTKLEHFDVSVNHLTGSLPWNIGLWTQMRLFSVSDNRLTGTIPETIAQWKYIEFAGFSDNSFTGSMPEGICEYIAADSDHHLEADCDFPCSCCTQCL